ncbi:MULTISPECIES: SigB/SigF/SigG family RNA polymerase sigma factor [Mycolicibacterium]|uniref:SigB/SigF/SigG family RNA polymerase sigma factor n=1 Tax=Mycolicibacterium monacense TaxID=85693 RepID=UPI0007E9E531|nr:SigB/SigF/SigG family RNA polymerase sigma factor [Mycolicibacterium monacense]OBB66073.1 RNA polymerase subunit sigma-70 [Mycolicibacterium monacense]OBF53932.1 RNA polymerase subunit sigma-70 [Mycolicibacterium monacense]
MTVHADPKATSTSTADPPAPSPPGDRSTVHTPGHGNDIDIDRLFDHLADSADESERQRRRRRIITACLPIADHIAYRFVGRGEPSEDVIQVARIGLIKTVDRYDATKGHFLAFAVPTIRGEIRRHFRDNTWTVRVPRKVQETQLRMRDAVNTLSQRLNRTPTGVELAEELDVGSDEIGDCQAATSAYRPASLDAPLPTAQNDGDTVGSMQGVDDPGYSRVEDLILLQEAISDLDPRRRAIVGMIFFDCLTQREVARRLHVSQVQISRLLNDALARIRERVNLDAAAALCVVGPFIGTV